MVAIVLPARFVQPINAENVNELNIPPDFTRKLLNIEAEARIRRVETHRIWTVEVITIIDVRGKRNYRLGEGWGRAVADNGILVGDFLVFEYCGNSVFTVTVCAPSGVIRPMDPGVNPQAGPRHVRGRRPAYIASNENAIAGSTLLAYSILPNFLVFLTPGYIHTSKPTVTLPFAIQYMSDEGDAYATLLVKGIEYPVVFSTVYRGARLVSCQIRDGFRDVIDGARLRTAYVLAFEMIDVTVSIKKFKVTVFGNP